MSSTNCLPDISDDESFEIYEDVSGWHVDAEGNSYCHGCESGIDCIYGHCTACNESLL